MYPDLESIPEAPALIANALSIELSRRNPSQRSIRSDHGKRTPTNYG